MVLGVLAVVLVIGVVSPRTAEGYVGEAYVETVPGGGVGDELTGPAKTILERPTFLPEELSGAAASGGVSEESAAAALFEGSGVLPMLGSALSFGVGAGIGTLICNEILELEGCWSFSSHEADPLAGLSGTWTFKQLAAPITFGENKTPTVPGYAWYWSCCGGQPIGTWTATVPDCGTSTAILPGASMSAMIGATKPATTVCEGKTYALGAATRYGMANRDLRGLTKTEALGSGFTKYSGSGYCPTESPTTCGSKPSTNWAERTARQLHSGASGISEAIRNKVGESIAAEIPGSGVKSPYKTYVNVPECSGEAWIGCKAKLEEKGLVPERKELDWTEVETTTPSEVIEMHPVPKTEVVTKTKVLVITNPDTSGMPLVIPKPGDHETYTEYITKLAPGLNPERVTVAESLEDPAHGPNGVLEVSPETGTKLNPAVKHTVEVTTNPSTTPYVPGGWLPPSIPAVDMSPLSGIPSPCTVFPFGLFCWVGEALAQFNTSGVCPHFSTPVAETGSDFSVTMCGETAETIMSYLRPAILLAFIVGCGFLFARGTKAIGDD